ncbi:2-acyl-glycerophospho-ethanolamine acyltransferase [Bacillus toyonensis]|nr:2-acyl-glycerophospho-ethanolamine acyltransferase [Bacillus toyonensis]PEN62022.1 2-acyl-glycerophospho-ethanolamine acyltransferase [Bacillus toyonensis]PGB26171.1 2-acyl-glycerophospho-ethanolamine acyltransferase [Bacillus toyonensis]PGD51634.1 2-acyl-glycerophospho-ethanolamine acyltransferase [Bacillus toyonensis]
MVRRNLNVFTKISSLTAIATIIILPIYNLLSSVDDSGNYMIRMLVLLTFYLSIFSVPVSILSMFSTEKLSKRIFALVVNVLPINLIIYALIMKFIDEFVRLAP